ncbi:MAG: trypsin-like peptidase domain-containing protein [Thermaerobacter sp.]|nr:trypsin-like peptidase domain-containing protein [Thermaerobacter sp.]
MPIHLDPRDLERHPGLADKVRQAMDEEEPARGPLRDMLEQPSVRAPGRGGGWLWAVAVLALALLAVVALSHYPREGAVPASIGSAPGAGGMNAASAPAALGAPTVSVGSVTAHAVSLRWGPVPYATRYQVERRLTGVWGTGYGYPGVPSSNPWEVLTTLRGTAFTDRQAPPGTIAEYRVAAQNGSATSPYSAVVTARVKASWEELRAMVRPSVVRYTTYGGLLAILGREVSCSGWMGPGGYIVTNYHCVRAAHFYIDLWPQGGAEVHARVAKTDPADDLAFLVPTQALPSSVVPLPLGGPVRLDEQVAVLGYPGGVRDCELTSGRVLYPQDNYQVRGDGFSAYIVGGFLMSAGGSPGNSGSVVVDRYGQVVGVMDASAGGNSNFAIPVADVRADLAQLGVQAG